MLKELARHDLSPDNVTHYPKSFSRRNQPSGKRLGRNRTEDAYQRSQLSIAGTALDDVPTRSDVARKQ